MKRRAMIRMLCIMVGSVLAAFLVPLAARAWLASSRPVEAPVIAALWGESQQVSDNTYGMHFYPAVAAQGSNVYAAWSKLEVTGTTDYDPYYNRAGNYGAPGEWDVDTAVRPTASGNRTVNVDMTVDVTDSLHFVWAEETSSPTHTLYYSYSNASAIQQIAQYGGPVVPAIAVSNDRVHVAWSEGTDYIQYTSKTIGTGPWPGSPTTIRASSLLANPAIAVDDNDKVHVAWNEGGGNEAEILYKNSGNWSSNPVTVSLNVANESHGPTLAVYNNTVYAAWCEYISSTAQYVRFGQSTDGGSNWDDSERISTEAFAAHSQAPKYLKPDIAVDSSGKIHAAFNARAGGSTYEDIYYVSKSGASWSSRQNVSEKSDRNSTTPAIAVSGDYVHVIWAEGATEYEVIHRRGPVEVESVYLPIILKAY